MNLVSFTKVVNPFHSLFAKIKTIFSSGTAIYQNLEILTCDPLKYKIDKSMLKYCINMFGKIYQNEKG